MITPALNGFLKGLLMVVVLGVASFLEDKANLTGVVNPIVATLIAAIASSVESHIRATTGRGLLGAVRVG
jgi:hypothetical protein